MNNRLFFITLDPQTGTVSRISHPEDPDFMNWCGETGAWGSIHHRILRNGFKPDPLELVEFQQRGGAAVCMYENSALQVTVERFLTAKVVSRSGTPSKIFARWSCFSAGAIWRWK
jgi:hypothetical protein